MGQVFTFAHGGVVEYHASENGTPSLIYALFFILRVPHKTVEVKCVSCFIVK